MEFDRRRALTLLRLGTGLPEADFHPGQEEAIRHVVEGRGRLLVVQRTGWGKSFVYFIATKILREAGFGPALLISPLLALMRNQIAAAGRMGVAARTINSDNREEWERVEKEVAENQIDMLLISPERLDNERFCAEILARISHRASSLVIDEAHCLSDWGHDFRPHYRLIERIIRGLPGNLRLLATTATANRRVMEDLAEVLGPNLVTSRGELARASLLLQTIRLSSQAERLAWLAEQIPKITGSGIIYTLTVRDAERVSAWLRSRGMNVAAYTSLTGESRANLEQDLLHNRVKALAATPALGMGFDKPDLSFVIHFQAPGSVTAYYQQVGRAGRGLRVAHGVLLSGREETEITDWFIERAFPTEAEVHVILDALAGESDGLSVPEIMSRVNVRRSRIEHALLLLSLESPPPLVKVGRRWQLTASEMGPSLWERATRLTALRREEQRQMQEYVGLAKGHMEFLIRALDGEPKEFALPALKPLPTGVSTAMTQSAVEFLRGSSLVIEPRAQWPAGGMPQSGVRGRILATHRPREGRALCSWGDAGWGDHVRIGKYRDGRFDDELVQACVELVRRWNPVPKPCWITCVPSLRHPGLIRDFAQRLAHALELAFADSLQRRGERPSQKSMENSVQQALNVDGCMEVAPGRLPEGPVLLMDDMVDSRWTLTVASWLLRSHGCGEIWPLVLAQATHR